MVLICSDVGHLFVCVLTICIYSLKKMSIQILGLFLKLGCPFIIYFKSLCIFWIIDHYYIYDLQLFSRVP